MMGIWRAADRSKESRSEEEDDDHDAVEVYDRHTHSHIHLHTLSVYLLLVNQFRGIHKVLPIEHDDGSSDGTCRPPEHHVGQSLRPRVA